MAELLRTNQVKAVYHGKHGTRALKELGRSYLTLTQDSTRVMNRIKSVYRSWAIPCAGTSVYAGSISSLMLTTETLVAEIPEEKKAPVGCGGHGGGMGDMLLRSAARSWLIAKSPTRRSGNFLLVGLMRYRQHRDPTQSHRTRFNGAPSRCLTTRPMGDMCANPYSLRSSGQGLNLGSKASVSSFILSSTKCFFCSTLSIC